jgi:hypothetical protein
MFVKQFFVICLLAATSVKATNIVLNADWVINSIRDFNTRGCVVEFYQQKVGALDVVTSIKCSYSFPGPFYNVPCDPSTVDSVIFSMSSLYYLPAMLFTTFPNLEKLVLENTDLTEIRPNTFQNAEKLNSITFKYCNIKNLPAYAFAAPHLQKIYIRKSKSKTIVDPNAFRGVPYLMDIEVSRANMTAIQNTAFIDTRYLERVLFQDSLINFIEPNAFAGRLFTLGLRFNNLKTVDKALIQNDGGLKKIWLDHNQLTTLDDSFFKYR